MKQIISPEIRPIPVYGDAHIRARRFLATNCGNMRESLQARRQESWERQGFIYFLGVGDPTLSHVKIGFTTQNPYSRMAELQTGCPFRMKMLGFVLGSMDMEQSLHAKLSRHRAMGEWFEASQDVGKTVIGALYGCEYPRV